jgi:DNA topoisomerase-1
LGFALVEALEKNKVDAVKPEMTERLENDMDMILEGTFNKEKVIEDSNHMLALVITELEAKQDQIRSELKKAIHSDTLFEKCPKCGNDLVLVKFKGGRFLKCSSPTCNFKTSLPKTGKIVSTDQKCEICGSPLIKILRKGQNIELRCIDDKCQFNKKKDYLGKCPNCGKDLVIRQSKNGKRFIGCTGYPGCTVTYPLPQKGKISNTDENCPICNAPLIILDYGKNKLKVCVNFKCSYNENSSKK